MTEILELSDQEFKTAMSNVLRAVMSKVNSMQEQMSNPQKIKQRRGTGQNRTEYPRTEDSYKKCNVCTVGRRGRKGTEDVFGIIMARHFPTFRKLRE